MEGKTTHALRLHPTNNASSSPLGARARGDRCSRAQKKKKKKKKKHWSCEGRCSSSLPPAAQKKKKKKKKRKIPLTLVAANVLVRVGHGSRAECRGLGLPCAETQRRDAGVCMCVGCGCVGCVYAYVCVLPLGVGGIKASER